MSFFEFFAGGGMARAGLGTNWHCTFANDFDFKKSAVYRQNWGGTELVTKDVGLLEVSDLPGSPTLVWASFPCQDLSLAGMGAGLKGDRSGTFWPFWKLLDSLDLDGRGPRVVVLENVCGTLTSHDGKDFVAIADALTASGYMFGALVIDACRFVPQSRPRLFIVAAARDVAIPTELALSAPSPLWHNSALRRAHNRLSDRAKQKWVWWSLPEPAERQPKLKDLIEAKPESVEWHSAQETTKLLRMMNKVNIAKVREAKKLGKVVIGTVYKRTRFTPDGERVQRAEVRFDGIAGCLRTASGGSSRQLIIEVKGDHVRSRLLSSREAARLMGLPDSYQLPENYNEAYHLAGDGVVVPVVSHLSKYLLQPLALAQNHAVHQVA